MAQTPESTEYDGMPRSAIATGLVDYVLTPAEMPAQLVEYVRRVFGRHELAVEEAKPGSEDIVKKACVLLRTRTGHDFSQYKPSTLARRVERRMAIKQIEHAAEYVRVLQNDPSELDALFRDLLIGVTNYFRDPEAFAALEQVAFPALLGVDPPGGTFRVWVCGCSTGEEAYSIAMMWHEQLERLESAAKVQIFATDISKHAIDTARAGVYPANIATDVSPERLARFFDQDPDGTFRVRRSIRDLVVFSEHDVGKDPPFSKLDLLVCRNLLIYLNGSLKNRLFQLFHYALKHDGVLFLGSSETVGEASTLFTALDRKWRICRRLPDAAGVLRTAFHRDMLPLARAQAAESPTAGHRDGKGHQRALTDSAR